MAPYMIREEGLDFIDSKRAWIGYYFFGFRNLNIFPEQGFDLGISFFCGNIHITQKLPLFSIKSKENFNRCTNNFILQWFHNRNLPTLVRPYKK